VVPLDTPDPKYAEYFLEIKRRIEANWVYPQEAIRRSQSGQGVVEFVLRKDGSLRLVEIVRSSGVAVLDRYMENAIKFAAPFPPMPIQFGTETIPVSLNFTYVLGGFRVFGFR
jgi:protein TonB